jgi:glycosyltransferase involved in cell wall biosynthesis
LNEDYGLVPYEAFLSDKPLITTTDAGGPLDIVRDGKTGRVVPPQVEALARALTFSEDEARTLGRAGHEVARDVTWSRCVERLLEFV